MFSSIVKSINELPEAAQKLIGAFPQHTFFAFYANMGAGKTTFIKEICAGLGVHETISSPTFSIVNEYLAKNGKKIFHFDFYRIKNIAEAFDMGCEEYFYSGNYCLVEWPDKIAELIPENIVKVGIVVNDDGSRTITAGVAN